MRTYRYWKTSEIRYLESNIKLSIKDLCLELGRTKSSVINFMHKNNIHSKNIWKYEDVKFIEDNCHQTYSWFALHFHVTKNAFAQFLNSKNIKLKDLRNNVRKETNVVGV